MVFYEEFARRFFREALRDLDRARRAFNEGDYPEVVFHAQQCVEKAIKAMIEARREYVCNHGPRLASIFVRVFENEWKDDYDYIVDSLVWLSEYYTRSRYPFLFRGRVISPDELIDREVAEKALQIATKVISIAERYLKDKGII